MADCGSTGTTLDRVAQSLLGNHQQSVGGGGSATNGGQILATLLGHAAASMLQQQSQQRPVPVLSLSLSAQPNEQLNQVLSTGTLQPSPQIESVVYQNTTFTATKNSIPPLTIVPVQRSAQSLIFNNGRPPTGLHSSHPQQGLPRPPMFHHPYQQQQHHYQQQNHHDALVVHRFHQQHQQHQQIQMQIHQQQLHHQFLAMQMQQQEQHTMWMHQQNLQKQQQQYYQQQHDHQQNRQRQQNKEVAVQGHEGVVEPVALDDLTKAWAEALRDNTSDIEHGGNTIAGHEGLVGPVGIDELAAAWAKAQGEQEEHWLGEDSLYGTDNNLWTGGDEEGQDSSTQYEFANAKESWTAQEMETNWMEEGYREFELGNMGPAIRAFEYELLRDGDSGHAAAAWTMLGRCHAEHDMDAMAIPCLEQAVDRDPYSVSARLALGVSYVNELNHTQALHHLQAWITHNPKFAGLDIGDDVYGSSIGTSDKHSTGGATRAAEAAFEEVQRLLLAALEFQATMGNGEDTADILEALGVVYNVSRDYDAAIDAFRKACDSRPADYQLWNKLGATLANSNQSEEALPAYQNALQLKPKYARAWLNTAISHSNLNQFEEAARCYLQTLSLNPAALHCWSYLRIALSCAERYDLLQAASERDIMTLKQHFDFVLYNDKSS